MGFSIRGDFAKLGEWQGRIRDAKRDAMERVAKNAGETMISLVRDGFESETDPYGKKWYPLASGSSRGLPAGSFKDRQGRLRAKSGRFLTDEEKHAGMILSGPTGNLRSGWHRASYSSSHCTIAPSVKYAKYHQDGTIHMPQRMMVPENGRLPSKWANEIVKTALEVLDDYFK